MAAHIPLPPRRRLPASPALPSQAASQAAAHITLSSSPSSSPSPPLPPSPLPPLSQQSSQQQPKAECKPCPPPDCRELKAIVTYPSSGSPNPPQATVQVPPLLPGQPLPQVGWFAVFTDPNSGSFIDQGYIVAVSLGPPILLTIDHAISFASPPLGPGATMSATPEPPASASHLHVAVIYPPPNVAPYAVVQLPALLPGQPTPAVGWHATFWTIPIAPAPPSFIAKAIILAVSPPPYAPATPLLLTLDHAISFVGSANMKAGAPRQSECHSSRHHEEEDSDSDSDCEDDRPHGHPKGCMCDHCCGRRESSSCQKMRKAKICRLESKLIRAESVALNSLCASKDVVSCYVGADILHADNACIAKATIDSLCVTNLTAPNLGPPCNLVRAYVGFTAPSTTYTLGSNIPFNNVIDDPSSMFSMSPSSQFTVSMAGYYDANIFLNLSGLTGSVILAGPPVASVSWSVNGTPKMFSYVPFLSFSTTQASNLAATLYLQAGDIVTAQFNVLFVDAVNGEMAYVGTMNLAGGPIIGTSGPSVMSIVLVSTLCSSNGPPCPASPCPPVHASCRPQHIKGCGC
jgi:hypothetical protein